MDQVDKMDSFYRDKTQGRAPEDGDLEDPLSFWHEEKKSSLKKNTTPFSDRLFLFVGAGLVLLALILFIFIPRGGSGDADQQLALLTTRLDQSEKKIGELETQLEAANQLQSQIDRLDKSILRMDGVDASIITRLDSISSDLSSLRKSASAVKTGKAGDAPAATAKAVEKNQKAASAAVYHTVSAGETLYSISRRYSVSVDSIRRLNGLSEKSSIQLGQKLKIKASDAD